MAAYVIRFEYTDDVCVANFLTRLPHLEETIDSEDALLIVMLDETYINFDLVKQECAADKSYQQVKHWVRIGSPHKLSSSLSTPELETLFNVRFQLYEQDGWVWK